MWKKSDTFTNTASHLLKWEMRIWAGGKWWPLLTWCSSLHTQHFFKEGISGCKPEWVQLLAFFVSQNVFGDVAPELSVPDLSPKYPESRVMQDCRQFLLRKNGLVMRGNRSVGGGGDGYMEPLLGTACISCCSTYETQGCHDPLKDHRPHQTILRSSTGLFNVYCLSKMEVSRWCITFHSGYSESVLVW